MMFGSALMVYLTIKEAGDTEDTSESIKKIILNFLQLTSLAASLPLQWPDSVDACLQGMATLSSAGSTLLIPDCELTDIPTADAFYMKQIAFALLVPGATVLILFIWSIKSQTKNTQMPARKKRGASAKSSSTRQSKRSRTDETSAVVLNGTLTFDEDDILNLTQAYY